VTTRVRTASGWRDLQEFLIVDRAEIPVEAVELRGIGEARPTSAALAAIEAAEVIVIGPSNPVISIGPILALPGMREAIVEARAPVIALSPYVAGRVVKGPTDAFMRAVGRPSTAAGVASLYQGLLDAIVCDEDDPDPPPAEVKALICPTLMEDAAGRRALARRVLELAGAV
jgi:LPPG:FO 2-phospho-L-lactate transferase